MKTRLNSLAIAALLMPSAAQVQMPHDPIYMGKKQICFAGMYGNSSWNQYWENALKRGNFTIGRHTTQSLMLILMVGISIRVKSF